MKQIELIEDEPKRPCKHYSLVSDGRDPKVRSNVIQECTSCGARFSIPQFTDPRRFLDGNRYTGD